ncbi:hypothetical protein CS022_19520 [Veronia nyctiphanis]|uniref:DUF4435 domain-containing protein n=1 Tax=Veronia nyctiphanis TaxID=1278244 RepID=A0A4Q0YS30_9GAMM|nr:DUF4435 domain-containing protein [Veronia nyctiphanis]RXJ71761.1 hypothetical protein CS022_19520 [Veronia nyctiphanis]
MFDYMPPYELVTEIEFSNDPNPWLLVEGGSDAKFFLTKNLPRDPKIQICNGWENVVSVISNNPKTQDTNSVVVGFIDRDYREELGNKNTLCNIVETDYRDLEISLFESSSLDKLLIEKGSSNKIPKKVGKIDTDEVRKHIYLIAKDLGKIRLGLLRDQNDISLKKIDYSKFIDKKSLNLNLANLVNQINAKNTNKLDIDYLKSKVDESCEIENQFICCGHDISTILGISLHSLYGNGKMNQEEVEEFLRSGYEEAIFKDTNMYKKLETLLLGGDISSDTELKEAS